MIALYIVLGIIAVILILLLVAVIRTMCLKKKTSSYEYSTDEKRTQEYAEKLSKMIQYETISVPGKDQAEQFRGFHKVLEGLFPHVFEHCEKIDIDGNLLMKWKGKNPNLDPIILISHQDVVPVEGEWKYPPFSGTIAEGKVYGRGSADIKSGVMSFYQAAEELIVSGYEPECDVYLGSSCTEEIGGNGAPKMVQWFLDHHIHLFMLSDEGGSIVEDPIGGVKGAFAAVGIFEKGYGDLKFTATSKGGHSSTPVPGTPLARLAGFVNQIEKHPPFKKKLTKPVAAMFESLAPYVSNFGLKLVMHNVWLFRPLILLLLGKISSEADAMFKTTCCFTMAKGSNGYNVIPSEAYVTANLRYIPHQGKEESNAIMEKIAKKYGLSMTWVTGNDYSNAMDLNGEPFHMTEECIHKIFPNVGVMPYVVTGGTDSRFYDPVCDNCIRFSPIMFTNEQLAGMHAINENCIASTLPGAVDYYKELIKIQEKRQ